MKVKFFHTSPAARPIWKKASNPVDELEAAVNAWLAANPGATVAHTQFQVAGGNGWSPLQHLVAIWYTDAAEPGPPPDPAAR